MTFMTDRLHVFLSPAVVQQLANKMLGFNLTTKQTPKDGVKVTTVSPPPGCRSCLFHARSFTPTLIIRYSIPLN